MAKKKRSEYTKQRERIKKVYKRKIGRAHV